MRNPHLLRLMQELDSGDENLLPLLQDAIADVLADAYGFSRHGCAPIEDRLCGWIRNKSYGWACELPATLFDRLPDRIETGPYTGSASYPNRNEAYRALVHVLIAD